jgi:hypothetical protein
LTSTGTVGLSNVVAIVYCASNVSSCLTGVKMPFWTKSRASEV